ncbi:hypothetical protein FO519_008220 [Halicephalobus sp. NKZ332]|nr:hypothetical protein FO519_008220 [Halicephalobus sp. NKZ332]
MDTEVPLSNFPSGNISSEYNENSDKIINIAIDIVSGATVLTSSFIIYLIFYKSPPMMSEYKRYLLVNVLLEMIPLLSNVTISVNMDTEVSLSSYPSGNISSEYNEESDRIVDIIIDVTSGTTLLTSFFIIYLIFYQSPPMMSEYKKYLLVNVLFEMVNVTVASLSKPKVLYGLHLAYTSGLLPLQQEVFTDVVFIFWKDAMILSCTCLALIHIERYYTIHQGVRKIITVGLVISGIFGDVFIHGDIVSAFLTTKMIGGKEFLQKYPGTVLLNNKHTIWVSIYYASLIVAAIFILIPLFTFLLLNAFSGFKAVHSNNYSQKTKKVHITLLQASILQVLLLLIFAAIPVTLLLVSLIVEHMIVGVEYMQCILNFYPLSDNIVILFFIKPYREFIFSSCRKNSVKEFSTGT